MQMSVAPAMVVAAAEDLAGIGSSISRANAAALAPITGVLPAGADEVSAAIAGFFQAHGQAYRALSIQALSFHDQFVGLISGGAVQYVAAEAASASPLQFVLDAINSPVLAFQAVICLRT